jgi:hypothetical protein
MLDIYLPVLMAIIACGSTGCEDNDTQPPQPTQVKTVYNQAYQENFSADSIDEIVTNAQNAYVLVDPFTDGVVEHISTIKSHDNEVGGYISAGTGEDWRDDYNALKPYLTTIEWDEWEGEYYVSQTTTGILDVMKTRIDTMASWGIDWVEYDNMDWLDEDSKATFNLQATEEEAKAYINTLCNYTRSKGMKCMAKNTVEGFEHFDGVLYESYNNEKNWWDTTGTQDFLDAGKLVIINHYNESDCDSAYAWYKNFYHTEKLSFICEDVGTQKYKHY